MIVWFCRCPNDLILPDISLNFKDHFSCRYRKISAQILSFDDQWTAGNSDESDYVIGSKNYYHSVANEVAGEKYIYGGTRHDWKNI